MKQFFEHSSGKDVSSGAWGSIADSDSCHTSNDISIFSSSLPVLPHEKLNLNDRRLDRQFVDGMSSGLSEIHCDVAGNNPLEGDVNPDMGNSLPDDEDELLAGLMDDFGFCGLPSSLADVEECDLFGSGGGMELEFDPHENLSMSMSKLSISESAIGNGLPHYGVHNGAGTVAGEHPYGEHPSRTLFVRNINSNIEDLELRGLFEQYGDIRTLYTACKHRGFVMISYYDIRAARTAMRALQNKPLRRRKLDIHFSIPKDNPSDKDLNQGTLVVFNLDPSVSNEDLRQIFGAYGEVKEIRETPHKRHHKFIEFYDVRAAEAALKSLNRSDIAGKRIKLEPSRPGGARRNLMLHLSQELEQDEPRILQQQVGSPIENSPPGNWAQCNSPIEHNALQALSKSPVFGNMSPTTSNQMPGLASILHPPVSILEKIAPIGKDQGRHTHMEHAFTGTSLSNGTSLPLSNSFPEPKMGQYHGIISSFGPSPSNGSGMETLSGPQFLWGSPSQYAELSSPPAWQTSSAGNLFSSNGKSHCLPLTGRQGAFLGSSHHHHHHHHHVGSAPSDVPLERRFGFLPESPEISFINPVAFRGRGIGQNNGSSSSFRLMSSPRLSPVYLGSGPYPGLTPANIEGWYERGRSRRFENSNGHQIDSKIQFPLDLEKIKSGEDTRTTLMIKNIPNKYTSKMLLAAIDENHKSTYDFLYLPIDFKNKCNVGYAFINMLSPLHIIPFYEAFNGKKWEKFNSEKVASLAYARIQGRTALVTHFQNSSLMNEDKRCRPILFHSDSPAAGDQGIHAHLNSNRKNVQVCPSNGLPSEDVSVSLIANDDGEKPGSS